MEDLKNLNILSLLGPPGCGKGSMINRCANSSEFIIVSAGELCRKNNSFTNNCVTTGKLIPDPIITSLVIEKILTHYTEEKLFILDGFPRTNAQAESFFNHMASNNISIDFRVLHIELSDAAVLYHATNRLYCTNASCGKILKRNNKAKCAFCGERLMERSDDTIEIAKKRLTIFRKHEEKLLNFYAKKNIPVISMLSTLPEQTIVWKIKNDAQKNLIFEKAINPFLGESHD